MIHSCNSLVVFWIAMYTPVHLNYRCLKNRDLSCMHISSSGYNALVQTLRRLMLLSDSMCHILTVAYDALAFQGVV